MSRKIILSTVGTMGDLYPFIAMALALRDRGFHPVLAVAADHVAAADKAGIEAVAVLPGFATIARRMGMSEPAASRRILSDQRRMFERVILPDLAGCAARLDALANDAEAIVASAFVLAAPIIAEKHRLPLVSIMLQPMAMLSSLDPPRTPDFWFMRGAPVGSIGRRWNRAIYTGARRIVSAIYGHHVTAVRAEHGLSATSAAKMFELSQGASLTLGCYSHHFAPLPADAPLNSALTGFPFYDGESATGTALDPALAEFLAAGPPPLVFTLGTFAIHAAGSFYDEAAEAAWLLGTRAVLLTGRAAAERGSATGNAHLFTSAYVPHSHVFPRASVVVHHGGIGTTGQALRAGKPQLVVPHMGDQHDHAARVERLGIGLRLAPARFKADRVAARLAMMLRDTAMQAEAKRVGATVGAEQGAEHAVEAIERLLSGVQATR